MRGFLRLTALLALFLAHGACASPVTPGPPGADLHFTGTVRFMSVEGGFWAIRGDDGVTYDPVNGVPSAFQREGLRVRVDANRRDDMAGTHMVGPIIEILRIVTVE